MLYDCTGPAPNYAAQMARDELIAKRARDDFVAKRERDTAYKERRLSSAVSSTLGGDEECDIDYTGIDYDADDTYAKIQTLFQQQPHKP